MLHNLISKVKLFIKFENKVILGRWNIDNCNKKRNIKIDFSNEDHCGSCSQYRLKKIDSIKENIVYISR
jgi:hypothetical protein